MNTSKDIPVSEANTPDFRGYAPEMHDTSLWASRLDLLDKMAKKSDRWWFIALLVIGMIYMGYNQWQQEKREAALRLEITDVRQNQLTYATSKNEVLMNALMNNTQALQENTRMLQRIENRRDWKE